MNACNSFVGCTPFEQKSIQAEVKSGFGTVKQKTQLTKLTVVVGGAGPNDYYLEGASVWVRSDSFKLAWAKDEFEVDGKTFILVPVTALLLHDQGE